MATEDLLQRKETHDIMQKNGVVGSTLDLGIQQNCLNKEYLELRQDGEEKPPSATEPTASAKG